MKINLLSLLKQVLGYCPIVGFLVVLSSLLFAYSTVQQVALIVTGVTFVLDYVINMRWRDWQWSKEKWVYVVCIAFFLLLPVWMVCGIETGPNLHAYMETYLPFALMGVVGIAGFPKQAKVEWFATVALATTSAVVIYISMQVDTLRIFEGIHSPNNVFNTFRALKMASHMQFNLYANMAMVLGVTALFQPQLHRAWRILIGVLMILPIGAVAISEGRAGLLAMLMIVGLSILYYTWQRNRIVAWTLAVLGSVAVGGVVMHSMQSHYVNMADEPRQYIWAVAVDQIKEHPWLGYGPSNGHELFVERGMQDADFVQYYASGLMQTESEYGDAIIFMAHPHNIFLETMIAYGVFGVLLLALLLLLPTILAIPSNRFPVLLCCLSFFVQGMFEKIGSHLNPLLWLIVLVLLLSMRPEKVK